MIVFEKAVEFMQFLLGETAAASVQGALLCQYFGYFVCVFCVVLLYKFIKGLFSLFRL